MAVPAGGGTAGGRERPSIRAGRETGHMFRFLDQRPDSQSVAGANCYRESRTATRTTRLGVHSNYAP